MNKKNIQRFLIIIASMVALIFVNELIMSQLLDIELHLTLHTLLNFMANILPFAVIIGGFALLTDKLLPTDDTKLSKPRIILHFFLHWLGVVVASVLYNLILHGMSMPSLPSLAIYVVNVTLVYLGVAFALHFHDVQLAKKINKKLEERKRKGQ